MFKWVLIGFFVLAILGALWDVSKGEYRKTETPIGNAMAACIYILLALGILYWL